MLILSTLKLEARFSLFTYCWKQKSQWFWNCLGIVSIFFFSLLWLFSCIHVIILISNNRYRLVLCLSSGKFYALLRIDLTFMWYNFISVIGDIHHQKKRLKFLREHQEAFQWNIVTLNMEESASFHLIRWSSLSYLDIVVDYSAIYYYYYHYFD